MEYDEDKLVQELRGLPAPDPQAGFEERALANAVGQVAPNWWPRRAGWGMAAAAAVLAAVLVVPHFGPTTTDPAAPQVAEAPSESSSLRVIDVLLNSAYAVEGASLTVKLDPNLALENYPDVVSLSWQTDLKAGGNKLSLPVRMLDDRPGDILVTLKYADTRQDLTIHVNDA